MQREEVSACRSGDDVFEIYMHKRIHDKYDGKMITDTFDGVEDFTDKQHESFDIKEYKL